MTMTRLRLGISTCDGSNIRGVLFDYGNTLVQVREGATVLRECLADLAYVVDSSLASKGMEVLKERWRERHAALSRGQRWTEEIRLDCYKTAISAIGLNGELDVIAKGIDRRWASREKGGVYEDVRPTLDILVEMDLSLGILSQTKMTGSQLKEELMAFDIARYFSVVLTSEDLGYDKPDPRFFDEGSRMIGLKNAELWYVGNRYHEDVVGARNAGLTPVLIERRPGHKSRDCISLPALLSLPPLLGGCRA